jgi:hypothetical protein
MLPRERVIAALEHREPDLIPWGEHSIDYNIYEMVLGRPTLVQAKFRGTKVLWEGGYDEVVASHKRDVVDLALALGFDVITAPIMPERSWNKPMEKIDEETYRDEDGNLFRISATTHDLMPYKLNVDAYKPTTAAQMDAEIARLRAEGVAEPSADQLAVIRDIVKRMKGTHYIASCVGDISFPTWGIDMEDGLVNMMLYPELRAKVNEAAGLHQIGMLKHYAAVGLDAVIPCGDYGSSTGLLASPEIFREHTFPWLKKYCDEAHRLGLKVIKHSCGCIWEVMDMLVEAGYDGYEAIQKSAGMDIRRLKKLYGGRLTLWGNVTNEKLILGSTKEVREDARYCIKWGAPGGGFIYGASHSLAVGTKYENLMEMKACRERWGVYPIRVK